MIKLKESVRFRLYDYFEIELLYLCIVILGKIWAIKSILYFIKQVHNWKPITITWEWYYEYQLEILRTHLNKYAIVKTFYNSRFLIATKMILAA